MLGLEAIGRRLFGTVNDRRLRKFQPLVARINALEPEMEARDDSALAAFFMGLREQAGAGRGLDDLLPESFACVRETARRCLGQRPFDVQLLGGIFLHQGEIAEMKTGEGKTLAATLPASLNALAGRPVHIVTVNDYLARRDAEWMGQIYNFLGLTVGCVVPGIEEDARKEAYQADILYATNNELGFDYLRDNMKYRLETMVQRGHFYAIVDEVDSILIDEARTPLIISGPVEDKSELYMKVDGLIDGLVEEDYELDEKSRQASFTERGNEHMEELLRGAGMIEGDLYAAENVSLVHHSGQALRAHKLFLRDRDYIVRNNEVVIIDEFTGRMMAGRRYGDGMHQALEAKERVAIQAENRTLASITFQNYFRLYEKLAGMTGTAATEAEEFGAIYGLGVAEIPTHVPVQRHDEDDAVYRTAAEKYQAICAAIRECRERGQPVLAGTVSIEKSEHLSELLKKEKIPHKVLNARYHEQEAAIIAEAGVPGAVTIATNMAGRGTDIQLGGNLEIELAAGLEGIEGAEARAEKEREIRADLASKREKAIAGGGLFVMGTERHESRRIDNQLRGRCGRQGDPGASHFFLSLEDDLMRIFGSERMSGMLQKLGLQEGEAIVHSWINKAVERAQARVEARNFDIRKNLLKYDDVMNDQRKEIFEQRLEFITAPDVRELVETMRHDCIDEMVEAHAPVQAYPEEWESEEITSQAQRLLALDLPVADWAKEEGMDVETLKARLLERSEAAYRGREGQLGVDMMRAGERVVMLQIMDAEWREHIQRLEHLRQIIGLRGYGQRDPLNEYKTEAFDLFHGLLADLREQVTAHTMRLELNQPEAPEMPRPPEVEASHPAAGRILPQSLPPQGEAPPVLSPAGRATGASLLSGVPVTASSKKPGRNVLCPCGSGRKYKHCHGR